MDSTWLLHLAFLAAALPAAAHAATPYAAWKNGPGGDPGYFPIAVWLQAPDNAPRYKDLGINLYVGLWKGPTAKQIAELKQHGMPVICAQNDWALQNLDEPTIVGWMHGDEPDNAHKFKEYWKEDKEKIREAWPEIYAAKQLATQPYKGYGPPVPPKWVVRDYKQIKQNDASRPVMLNLGQGVAYEQNIGRGERTGKLEDYPEYIKGCDIASFDIYPVVHRKPDVAGKLWFVPRGVDRLRDWTRGEKPVWSCIECTRISNVNIKPTPDQVKTEVWMALIHGANGLIYFVHQFKPQFIGAGLLADAEMCAEVKAINAQIHALAPVLNSPTLAKAASVQTDSADAPVDVMVKRHGGATYVFAVAMRPEATTATFTLKGVETGNVDVIGENRNLVVKGGSFSDAFEPYAVHLYRIK